MTQTATAETQLGLEPYDSNSYPNSDLVPPRLMCRVSNIRACRVSSIRDGAQNLNLFFYFLFYFNTRIEHRIATLIPTYIKSDEDSQVHEM